MLEGYYASGSNSVFIVFVRLLQGRYRSHRSADAAGVHVLFLSYEVMNVQLAG